MYNTVVLSSIIIHVYQAVCMKHMFCKKLFVILLFARTWRAILDIQKNIETCVDGKSCLVSL